MGLMAQHRTNNIMKAHEEMSRNAASAISQLNSVLDQALKFGAMMDKDPRAEFTEADKAAIRARLDAVFAGFNTVAGKAQDLGAMRTGSPTADEVLAKYGMTSSYADYVDRLD